MNVHTIRVEGMTDDDCVEKVLRALYEVDGIWIRSVEVGSAEIECELETACAAACDALSDAGYDAHPVDTDAIPLLSRKANRESQEYPPVNTETTPGQMAPHPE
jgi:copper chaperone CopZ